MILTAEEIVYAMNAVLMMSAFVYLHFEAFFFRPLNRRFHYYLSQISLISALCYYMLFLDVGRITSPHGTTIMFPRHVDWLLTTPIQLTIITTITNITPNNVHMIWFLDVMMIICGFLAEWTNAAARWILFGTGLICFLPITILLFFDFDQDVLTEFTGTRNPQMYNVGRYLLAVWAVYPVAWTGVMILHNGPAIAPYVYAALDILSKYVFCVWVYRLVMPVVINTERTHDHDRHETA